MSLVNSSVLVNLNISQWTGFKKDKRATQTVEFSHGTDAQVGNFNKRLLPKAKELEQVGKVAGQIRTFFYEQTLPWLSDGSRILPSANFMVFNNDFKRLQSDFEIAVNDFLATYPSLKAKAKQSLGDLFSESDYPDVNTLRRRFACDVQLLPVPAVNDFRIPEIQADQKEKFLQSMVDVERNAMREVYTRLQDVVSNAAQKLADPQAIFRDSLIENISEISKVLERLNISNDQNFEAVRVEAAKLADSLDQDALRKNPKERAQASKSLDELASKMGSFMGME